MLTDASGPNNKNNNPNRHLERVTKTFTHRGANYPCSGQARKNLVSPAEL